MVYLLFKGARLEFLTQQIPAYEKAVAEGTTKEFLDVVYARYARRFPIELPLTEEPSPDFLAAVDDNAPEPEPEVPTEELSPEELEIVLQEMNNRQDDIQKRRKVCVVCFRG